MCFFVVVISALWFKKTLFMNNFRIALRFRVWFWHCDSQRALRVYAWAYTRISELDIQDTLDAKP